MSNEITTDGDGMEETEADVEGTDGVGREEEAGEGREERRINEEDDEEEEEDPEINRELSEANESASGSKSAPNIPAQTLSNSAGEEEETSRSQFQLPLSRVKTLMKLDPEVSLASQEAVALIAMATRLFLASVARDSAQFTLQHKKKTVQRRDVDAAIDSDPKYAFLEGMIDF